MSTARSIQETPGAARPAERSFETASAEATRELAAELAAVARPGDRITLSGPLGAGKTQFAKGFARGLGVDEVVNSPSFTLIAEYVGRLPLFHMDLYRLSDADEARAGGSLDDRHASGVTLVEWPERLALRDGEERLDVGLEVREDDRRRLVFRAVGSRHARYLDALDRLRGRGGG